MTHRALRALKSSIAHWRRLATGRHWFAESIGPDDCALCEEFCGPDVDYQCRGCPVFERTRRKGCARTPFIGAFRAWSNNHYDLSSPKFRRAAAKELKFLESLLPVTVKGKRVKR